MKNALIIFTKSLVYGKVKTRLAATVGNNKAFEVYQLLINHTHAITHQLTSDKIVFYTDDVEVNDVWMNSYQKQLQTGNDLGEKMMNAFNYMFINNYLKSIIIGCDCPELTGKIINDAFEQLDNYDVVIGPAADGGYYLLAMKKMYKQLFKNVKWSTNKVFDETIQRCNQNELSYFLLPLLHDVDEEKDLQFLKAIL